ncbi:MAG: hypothetical protein P4L41_05340 [Flavipsychrobacter sp.]|nr:hypothetical protein [Flavipsychrobacter sp.]
MISLKTIVILSHLPILATVVLAALRYGQLSKPLQVFSWFIFLSGAIQFTSLWLCLVSINNMPLLHIYVATGFPCLVWFYKTVLGNFISNRIVWGIAILFLLFSVINSLFVQNIFRFNSNALAVESILIIILALFTFIFFLNDTMMEQGIPNIKSLTWINSGLFIYYLSCLMIFYFGDTILFRLSKDLSRHTWVYHSFFSTVMYICFFAGLWKRSKTPRL